MPAPSIVGTPTATRYTSPLVNTAGADANYAIGLLHDDVGALTLARTTVGAMAEAHAYAGMNSLQVFGQANPTAGAQDCTPSSDALTHIQCTAKDVLLSDAWDAFVDATGNSTSPAVTCSTDTNALALAFVVWNGAFTIAAGADETVVMQYTEDSRGAAIISKAGGASVSFAPTLSGSTPWGITAAGLNGTAASGPTIDTQPEADTVLINGDPTRASASFTVAATTSGGTLTYQWELETSVGGGTYGNVASGSGATWAGGTTTNLTATFTAKTLTGRRVRCVVTDDNGSTTSNAVALTVYTGPVLSSTSGTTNESGVSTVGITSDYPNADGEFTVVTATAGGVTKQVALHYETPA